METREPVYKYFRPAWKSFYKSFALMILLIVLAACAGHFVPYLQENPAIIKWLWIAVVIIDVLILLTIAVKRATMVLILKDNPNKPDDQEVDFTVCHPARPFSSDFRESIQIGFQNIVDIKVGQTAMQTLMNVG
ncbi:MAG: hypothetical protein IJP97_01965, partial [Synergistaceae bacterium]|nr:hypothetical protein [Synergistaceae bacterium]